jgi:four helix bundle protein
LNPDQLKKRSQDFAVDIITFCKAISADFIDRELLKQLVRCAASSAANYRAACRARSKAEFYAKLSIVVEEADESLFWLEIIEKSSIADNQSLAKLKDEALQLLKIFASSRKSAKTNN